MIINDTFFGILEEQNILGTTKTKPIVDAIKNRNKISFYYSGPRVPKKDSVKPGYRVKAEAVAMGLSKKGNLIVRAYVQPPSTTKTGFGKGGWRTFIVGRMSNVNITDEKFDSKRPNYKEGDDNSMTVTYVTADWTNKSAIKKPRIVKPKPTVQTPKPEVQPTEPKPEQLPQPKPEVKPEPISQDSVDQNITDKQKELYNKKTSEWVTKQKEMGGNIKPGQGTRERFKKEVEKELPQPKPEVKPEPTPEEDIENKKLQESIKKIKSLMFS